jgi:hypothetical protein
MTGIITPLVPANHVVSFRKQIDHTPFAFIAPVYTDYRCKHFTSSSVRVLFH